MKTTICVLQILLQTQANGQVCNHCHTADIAIICGTIFIVCLMAFILLLNMMNNSNKRKLKAEEDLQIKNEKEHTWALTKEDKERREALQERSFKKKHEYTQELLKYFKENNDRDNYVKTANSIIEELGKECSEQPSKTSTT